MYAHVLIQVVVTGETLVADLAQERLLVGVNRANMSLQMLGAFEELAAAGHLAGVNFARFANVSHLLRRRRHSAATGTFCDDARVGVLKIEQRVMGDGSESVLSSHGER